MEGDEGHNEGAGHKEGDGEEDGGAPLATDGCGDSGDENGDDGGVAERSRGPGRQTSWARAYFKHRSSDDHRCWCVACERGPFGSTDKDAQPVTLLRHLQQCVKVGP